jgi:A/G-specific adenine glycosylase
VKLEKIGCINIRYTPYMNRQERISKFVREIWLWYARHKRELPWRDLSIKDDTQRAYKIMVSEIMLQQTQVERVKIVYRDFLERFPSITDLASASNAEVIQAWRGMGYNNRALRLRDCAKSVVKNNNRFPVGMDLLQQLPGIGHYTAAAIRNFAFNIPTPCIDTNIRRILHRVFVGPEKSDGTWKKDDQYLLIIAEEVLEKALSSIHYPLSTGRSKACADWHAALMDFGSLVCTKRSPKWDICPLTRAGIMKAAYKVDNGKRIVDKKKRKEPGRMVGSKYIPNRIFRGKVVDELRDETSGLTAAQIGKRVCIDWDPLEHTKWLEGIIASLKKDHLIESSGRKIVLAQ